MTPDPERGAGDPAVDLVDPLRRHDRERFQTALFAPPDRRTDLMALYAFNLEVARVREIVSEPILGQIRLQWWRETLDGIYAGTPRRHPVAERLAAAVSRHDLPRAPFDRIIDARERDLEARPFSDTDALMDYVDATSCGLLRLAAWVLDSRPGEGDDHDLQELGRGYALTGLVRSVPFHLGAGRVVLPDAVLARHGIDPDALNADTAGSTLVPAVVEMAEAARGHLAAAWAQRKSMPASWKPLRLLAVVARAHLAALARARHDVDHPSLARIGHGMAWRLAWAALTRRY